GRCRAIRRSDTRSSTARPAPPACRSSHGDGSVSRVSQFEDFEQIDYFTDPSLVEDPYPYFEYLRSMGPVSREPKRGVVAVTGYDEAVPVSRNSDTFSSCNSVIGPYAIFPVPLEGDDVSETIARHRDKL